MKAQTTLPRSSTGALLVGVLASLSGCSEGDAPKAWNALSTCIAGAAAKEPLAARAQALRAIQLANASASPGAQGWPGRCGSYADAVYAALPTSGQGAVLKRKLGQSLSCADEKGSCKFPPSTAVLGVLTDLWDAAKDSGLAATETVAGVPLPEVAPAPLLDAKSWKSFSTKPLKVAGPISTGEGRALLLLKATEGRMRPLACEVTDKLSKLSCFEAHADVPELPAHSIEVVNDEGAYAAGLTEKGLIAYDLKTGQPSAVRGNARRLIRDGVAVEPKASEDSLAQSAKAPAKSEGFIAVELKEGKVLREVKLPVSDSVGDPIGIGAHVLYLERTEAGAELSAKRLVGGRLKHEATVRGAFSGAFHTCRRGDQVAVATFASRAGISNAKATGGAGKTQVTFASYRDGAWSPGAEITIPFDRAFESELICTASGASLAWAQPVEGGASVGRIDCDAGGCKSNEVKLPGVDSKWWWTVAPLGDQTLLLWRAALGETRLRMAPLAGLAGAKDSVVFDAPDFDGPSAGELSSVLNDDAALLLFRDEKPVAMHVARDGAVRLLTP